MTSISRRTVQSSWRWGVLLCLLSIQLFAGCGQSASSVTEPTLLDHEDSSREVPEAVTASLSKPAQKLNQLIDDGKYNAADKLLDSYLGQFPEDGAIHAMRGKLQLATTDIVFDFVPAESRIGSILNACQTAVEFDPKLKTFVADMIWHQVISDLKQAANDGEPIVFADLQIYGQEAAEEMQHTIQESGNPMANLAQGMQLAGIPMLGMGMQMRFGHTMVPGSWNQALSLAYDLDASVSTKWTKQLEGISSRFADCGWFASGFFLEQVRTYYEGEVTQEERVVTFFDLLTDRSEQIESSKKLKARAKFALDQLIMSGWKEEIKEVIQTQDTDSEIHKMVAYLAD